MKRKSELYLQDIIEAINRVKEYTSSMEVDDLRGSKITIDATTRNLEIIGEAVSQLPQELKDKYPHIPWRDINDFRNVVAHKYWNINIERVWDIIENKLDQLNNQVNEVLQKEQIEAKR